MKISNEVKVGILAISAIAILIFGYSYLKGNNILKSTNSVFVEYEDVAGLVISDPVRINGYKVGTVGDIKLKEDYSGVIVTLELEPDIKIPRPTTVAKIESASIMGEKVVVLDVTGICRGEDCVKDGDQIKGKVVGMVEPYLEDAQPYINKANEAFARVDSMIKGFSSGEGGSSVDVDQLLNDFQGTLSNLNSTTAKLNGLLASSSADIQSTLDNINALSETLKNKSGEIDQIVSNAAKITKEIEEINLKQTVGKVETTVEDVDKLLKSVDGTVADINGVLAKINNNEGTLGKLVNDEALYNNLNKTLEEFEVLAEDIRLNPKRYFALFRKKVPEYEAPAGQ